MPQYSAFPSSTLFSSLEMQMKIHKNICRESEWKIYSNKILSTSGIEFCKNIRRFRRLNI